MEALQRPPSEQVSCRNLDLPWSVLIRRISPVISCLQEVFRDGQGGA